MKIVTCASYHGTGSSALTDLISEYEGVKSLGDYEFPFLYAMDGVSDLEYHIVQCPDRHLSGYSIKRFEKFSKFNSGKWFNHRYEPFFNNMYWKHTKEYINSLIEFTIPGSCFYEEYDRGILLYYLNSLRSKILKRFNISRVNPKQKQFFSHLTETDFIEKTKCYTRKLFSEIVSPDTKVLMVDQLIPSSNVERCMRYLDDNLYVFIVDRDPRDIYLLNKYKWKETSVPTEPSLFCQWFRYTHQCEDVTKITNPHVKRLYFEDLIYKYRETVEEVELFCGLEPNEHVNSFSKLNPKRSVVNTRLWNRYNDSGIMIINKELSEFLYPYDGIDVNSVLGIETKDSNLF